MAVLAGGHAICQKGPTKIRNMVIETLILSNQGVWPWAQQSLKLPLARVIPVLKLIHNENGRAIVNNNVKHNKS